MNIIELFKSIFVFMKKRVAEIFIVAVILLSINYLVFSYLLADRENARANEIIGNLMVGKNNYPALESAAAFKLFSDIGDFSFSGIDYKNKLLYIGGNEKSGSAAILAKYDLTTMARLAELQIPASLLKSGVIDSINNSIYLGLISNDRTKIAKIDLQNFKLVKSLEFLPEAGKMVDQAIIDKANNFAYFMRSDTNGTILLKINIAPSNFSSGGVITVGSGKSSLPFAHSLVVQPQKGGGNLYIANQNKINKVSLKDFKFVASFNDSSYGIYKLLGYDADLDYLYYSTKYDYKYTQLRRVNLNTFKLDNKILNLNTIYDSQAMAVDSRDPGRHYGYIILSKPSFEEKDLRKEDPEAVSIFQSSAAKSPLEIVKINLSSFAREGRSDLAVANSQFQNLIPDYDNNNLQLITAGQPTYLHTINIADNQLKLGTSVPLLLEGEKNVSSGVIDSALGSGYFTVNAGTSRPAKLIKVNLAEFKRLGTLDFLPGERQIIKAFFDPINHFAYFATDGGVFIKINLLTLERLESLNLGLANVANSYFDAENNVVYFISNTKPANLVKVSIAPESFKVLGSLTTSLLGSGALVADIKNSSLYMANTDSQGGFIAKIDLVNMVEVSKVSTGNHVGFKNALIDQQNNLAYFISQEDELIGVNIDPLDFDYSFSYDMPLDFHGSSQYVQDALAKDTYYFLIDKLNADKIVKLKITVGKVPEILASYALPEGGNQNIKSISIDNAYGYIYLGGEDNFVSKYKYAPLKGKIMAFKVKIQKSGFSVAYFDFYSHKASGNLKLALYDIKKNLIWQSSTFKNTAENSWLRIKINENEQKYLSNLDKGEYWLAWQTDSPDNIASYVQGKLGDGFEVRYKFGLFPKTIRGEINNSNIWSIYGTKL